MSLLKKLVSSRYFPSATKPVVTGLVAAGITYGLHALGVYTVPAAVQEAITPVAGLLAAAVVATPGSAPVPSGPSVGSTIAEFLRDDIAGVIDANPDLLQTFTQSVIHRASEPTVVKAAPEDIAAMAGPITTAPPVAPPPVFDTPAPVLPDAPQLASPPAPHIEQ